MPVEQFLQYHCKACKKEWKAFKREYGMCPFCNSSDITFLVGYIQK